MSLLEVQRLQVTFATDRGPLRAIDDVSFSLERGAVLGLVGESGSGKSTLARALLRLGPRAQGRVLFDGVELLALDETHLRPLRRRMQPVFQDPSAALDPRCTIGATLAEAFLAAGVGEAADRRRRVGRLLSTLGLPEAVADRFPRELSAGQRQRVCIGRALAVGPELVLLDEPVSALDVSVQAQVLELLLELRKAHGLTYVFITHDLGLVAQVCTQVAVMNLGRIVELGSVEQVLAAPRHPYTRALLDALPPRTPADRGRRALPRGEPPSPLAPPVGCGFHPRCARAQPRCREARPPLEGSADRSVACFFPLGEETRAA